MYNKYKKSLSYVVILGTFVRQKVKHFNCEDKKCVKSFIKINFKYFYIYDNQNYILVEFFSLR